MIRTNKISSGTYGIAYSAKTSKDDKTEVAIKRNIVDADISFSGSIRELDLLNRLRGHPYIVKLLSVSFGNPFIAPNSPIPTKKNSQYREDYLHFIMELGQKNLHSLIYETTKVASEDGTFKIERTVHVSYLKLAMVQTLLAIEYMHAKGVVHRDIKPANLLWFNNEGRGSVKLCDFGLSKIFTDQEPKSPRVVTCWYRAPEICAQHENYSFASDMWSVGVVFYEMIARNALLIGSKDDDTRLLSKIVGVLPSPEHKDIVKMVRDGGVPIKLGKEASPRFRKTWKTMINLSPADIEEFNRYPSSEANYDNFLNLLDRLLQLNPEKRLTATQALAHEFFIPYQNIIDWSRSNFPPIGKDEYLVEIFNCTERKWATKLAFTIFNDRTSLAWYRHRIIFQSIDMFDRYLIFLKAEKKNEKLESEYSGKYMTRYETQLRYVVCLYICIKYFTTLNAPISFLDLATAEYKTAKALIEAEEFEKKMLRDVLKFKIFRETLFECNDRKGVILSELQIRDLLYHYGTCPSLRDVILSDLLAELLCKVL